ncbi:hypothetical protein MBLNU459_g4187t1 [Dothideomycetes sp. NU459]
MTFTSALGSLLSISPFILVPSLLLTYYLLWIVYARTLHPLARVPGPFLASISRLWVVHHLLRGDMEHEQRRLHAKHGALIRIAPNEVACASPAAIKTIYPVQKPLQKTDFYPVWGNAVFSKYADNFSCVDERVHADRRRIVNSVYSLSNVLQSERYAFDVVGELYFGRMFGFMQHRHDHGNYIESLDALIPGICATAVSASYARPLILASSLLLPTVRKGLKAIDHIAAAAKACVARRVEEQSCAGAGADGGVPRRDLLQQLLEIQQSKGEKVDFGRGEVEQEAYVALFAGSDTTAIALRSVFYHLIKTPSVYAQLMAELDAAAAAGQLSFPVQYAEAIKLPLLCACIKEAMRLHPSVGLTMPRISPAGGLLLCDRLIPAGYRVGMNAAVVHFDKDVFGADADQFRPSRWIEGDATMMDRYMLHFGAGTRTCIGKNISLSELHKLVPQVLRMFSLELADPSAQWKTSNMWFNKQTNLSVRLTRRTG